MLEALQRVNRDLLTKSQIQLWQLNTRSANYTQEGFALLSNDEQQRARRLKSKNHQQRFIATRIALRQLLAKTLNFQPENIRFSYNSAGRPQLKHPVSALQFNIAHSDQISLIAITKSFLIGVDIEQIKQDINHLPIANTVFCEKEIQHLLHTKMPSQLSLFYRIWTIKEAVLKLLGTGFSLKPSSFCVNDALNKKDPIIDLSALKRKPATPTKIRIIELKIDSHHSVALAISNSS